MSRLDENLVRQDWMGLLAQAPSEVLEECTAAFGEMPSETLFRSRVAIACLGELAHRLSIDGQGQGVGGLGAASRYMGS